LRKDTQTQCARTRRTRNAHA